MACTESGFYNFIKNFFAEDVGEDSFSSVSGRDVVFSVVECNRQNRSVVNAVLTKLPFVEIAHRKVVYVFAVGCRNREDRNLYAACVVQVAQEFFQRKPLVF